MKVGFGGSHQLQNGITRVFVGVHILCVSLNIMCLDTGYMITTTRDGDYVFCLRLAILIGAANWPFVQFSINLCFDVCRVVYYDAFQTKEAAKLHQE